MPSFFSALGTIADLFVVVLAFTLIIVIHELGHFLAARWAKIRVLAFAVGFGPALVSYRKGLGFRRGSSEDEYRALPRSTDASPTEYRLNVLPFGGYVKMLGQDDADPTAKSDAPDSYQNCVPWKRMVVISAGVTANVILAVILFIVVFSIGLRTEPAHIGSVDPAGAAAKVVASNASALGVTTPGLQPGDRVIAVNDEKPETFNDLALAGAMARAGRVIRLDVERPEVNGVLRFEIVPIADETSRLLSIGLGPGVSGQVALVDGLTPADRDANAKVLEARGLGALRPGLTLSAVAGKPTTSPYEIQKAVDASAGKPVRVDFKDALGATTTLDLRPTPALQRDEFKVNDTQHIEAGHLLGLMPVLAVRDVDPRASKAGLRADDVFVRLGSTEYPSLPAGIAEIRKSAGATIHIVVARRENSSSLQWQEVDLGPIAVSSDGKVGFEPRDSSDLGTWVARLSPLAKPSPELPSGAFLPIPNGSQITSINGRPIATLGDLRSAIANLSGGPARELQLDIQLPLAQSTSLRPVERVTWAPLPREIESVRVLGYRSTLDLALFKPEQVILKGTGIVDSASKGFKETKRVMTMTYLTFARLFQGSVKVEHLKGPVGIAHVGVVIAEKGFVWLMFFMALISVNLAVVNFLPIPIADGGHMVYLIYEQFSGRPPPLAVQNAAALAGLIVLGSVFLLVTFNDVSNVLRALTGG